MNLLPTPGIVAYAKQTIERSSGLIVTGSAVQTKWVVRESAHDNFKPGDVIIPNTPKAAKSNINGEEIFFIHGDDVFAKVHE